MQNEFTFTIQGKTVTIEKITLQQDIDFMKYVDKYWMEGEFKGKGLFDIVADTLEKLPGLMQIIFRNNKEADTINWLDVDTDTLLDIKSAFEKKNPTTIGLLKSSLKNSGFRLEDQLTGFAQSIQQIFSSMAPPAGAQPTQTT